MSNSETFVGRPTCGDTSFGECLPSGNEYDNLFTRFEGYFPYHSPGLACPSGWTTALTVKGTDIIAALAQDRGFYDESEDAPLLMHLNGLKADETLAWCCPR
jgi:hypothetical protein